MLSNVTNNLQLWDHDYDWSADGDEWEYQADRSGVSYSEWKSSLVSHLIEPYARDADVLEIAPGHGRWSEFIIGMCRHATLVDLGPKCLEYCRTRFAEHGNVDYFLTTGTQLPYHAAGVIDFVFSVRFVCPHVGRRHPILHGRDRSRLEDWGHRDHPPCRNRRSRILSTDLHRAAQCN